MTTYGIEWGIFVALAIAIGLILAGSRIRAAHRPEPPLPGDEDSRPSPAGPTAARRLPADRARRLPADAVVPADRARRARSRPTAPADPEMPVLEARIVPPEPSEAATGSRTLPARGRAPESVDFVPSEPAEFVPHHGPPDERPPRPRPASDRVDG